MITGRVLNVTDMGGETDPILIQRDNGLVQVYYPPLYLHTIAGLNAEYIQKERSASVDLMDKVNNLNDTNDNLRRQNDSLSKQNKKLRAEVANLKSLLPTDD